MSSIKANTNKLQLSKEDMKTFGLDAFKNAISYSIDLTDKVEYYLRKSKD